MSLQVTDYRPNTTNQNNRETDWVKGLEKEMETDRPKDLAKETG
jgi:hypothetical protein